jgi:hypothetical protein
MPFNFEKLLSDIDNTFGEQPTINNSPTKIDSLIEFLDQYKEILLIDIRLNKDVHNNLVRLKLLQEIYDFIKT